MKKILTILSVLFAAFALVSCNKTENDSDVVMTYYRYDFNKTIFSGTNSSTNVSAIDNAINARPAEFDNMNDSQAKQEWKNFVASVDDSKVVFGTDSEFYEISFVKVNVYQKGEFGSEGKVVATIGKKTWKKSGAVEE